MPKVLCHPLICHLSTQSRHPPLPPSTLLCTRLISIITLYLILAPAKSILLNNSTTAGPSSLEEV